MSLHSAAMRRRFPHPLPVASIGWLAAKTSAIDHPFATCNYSFILRGSGWYEVDGRRVAIEAPAVITQWPGPVMHYGPDGSWEELFLIYGADRAPVLDALGYLRPHRRYWHIGDAGSLHTVLRELRDHLQAPRVEECIDRIDRCCERLICESLLAAAPRGAKEPEEAVRAIRREVERDHLRDHDFAALARSHGLSPPWFRRLWTRQVGLPPHRFVVQLRLRQACRLLVESRRAIGEIAAACGFQDALYFARCFKRFAGQSASAYRERHRYDASLLIVEP